MYIRNGRRSKEKIYDFFQKVIAEIKPVVYRSLVDPGEVGICFEIQDGVVGGVRKQRVKMIEFTAGRLGRSDGAAASTDANAHAERRAASTQPPVAKTLLRGLQYIWIVGEDLNSKTEGIEGAVKRQIHIVEE